MSAARSSIMSGGKLLLRPYQKAALKEMVELERDRMRYIIAMNQQMNAIISAHGRRRLDGRGHGNGYGAAAGYGDGNGYGETAGFSNGDMAEGQVLVGHESFNSEDGAFIWSDVRPTERVFRCPGCIGGYECSIHGRRL